MNTLNKTLLLSLSTVFAGVASAEWTLVNDFNEPEDINAITDYASTDGSNARSEIIDGRWAAFPGDVFEANSNLYASLDLGVDLKAAADASFNFVTVYSEVIQPSVPDGLGGTRKAIVDTVWGLYNTDDPLLDRYNQFNTMARINVANDNFEPRNGGDGYVSQGTFTADVVYSTWMVVDYGFNEWRVYVQGGTEWPTQTLLMSGEASSTFTFRANPAPTDTVDSFLVALSRGNTVQGEKGLDPTYFDNIYVDITGENLTMPGGSATPKGPGIFADLDMDENSWVDAPWMGGWVYTSFYPWCYSNALDTFFYATGEDTTSPVWIYILR